MQIPQKPPDRIARVTIMQTLAARDHSTRVAARLMKWRDACGRFVSRSSPFPSL
jgi:hypothetical protein